jgi:hypothetical protein
MNSFNVEAQVGEIRVDVPPVPHLERSLYHFDGRPLRHRPCSIPADEGGCECRTSHSDDRRMRRHKQSPKSFSESDIVRCVLGAGPGPGFRP